MDWFELFFFVLRKDCLNCFGIDQFCLKDMTSALIGDIVQMNVWWSSNLKTKSPNSPGMLNGTPMAIIS